MKKNNIEKIIAIMLLSTTLSISITACKPKQKIIIMDESINVDTKEYKKDLSERTKDEEVLKEKDIVLIDDVKKETENEEMETFKLEKVKELQIYDELLEPLCWKDDKNFIAIKTHFDNDKTYSIYNVSAETSTVTKINTIKNTINIRSKRILYVDNFKFYIYDLVNNTKKEVFDLSQLKRAIEEENQEYYIKKESNGFDDIVYSVKKRENENDPVFKIESDRDFISIAHTRLVKGSNKYISILSMDRKNGGEIIRILDLETGKIVKSKPFKDYNLSMSNECGFMYNKNKDTFYLEGGFFSQVKNWSIYEYELRNPNTLKEMKKLREQDLSSYSISDDENYIYFVTYNDAKASIVRYDIINDKFDVIFKDKPKGYYSLGSFKGNSNFICYSYYKEKFNSQEFTFVGTLDEGKIKNVQKLPVEKLYDKCHNFNSILYHDKEDKFIYKVSYFYEEDGIHYEAAKYYLYKTKNNKAS